MWLVSAVVRRYIIDILIIIITFPYSTCISSFFGSIIPISLFIFKSFFDLVYNYNGTGNEKLLIRVNVMGRMLFPVPGLRNQVNSIYQLHDVSCRSDVYTILAPLRE